MDQQVVDLVALHFTEWVLNLSPGVLAALEHGLALERQLGRDGLMCILAKQADEVLALAVQKGFLRAAAFTELFVNRYEHLLIRWFRRWGTDAHTAYDLSQEIFLKFHQTGLKGYQPDSPFCSYLYTTAHNLWVSKEIRQKRCLLTDDLDRHTAKNTALKEVEDREVLALLGEAVAALPEDQRVVFALVCEEELPHGEVAMQLDLPVENVYQLLHRARKTLEEMLPLDLPPTKRGRKPKKDRTP